MDDILISALAEQAMSIERWLYRLHGMPEVAIPIRDPSIFYGCEFHFKDGIVVSYGWRKEERDGRTFLVPFAEKTKGKESTERRP